MCVNNDNTINALTRAAATPNQTVDIVGPSLDAQIHPQLLRGSFFLYKKIDK